VPQGAERGSIPVDRRCPQRPALALVGGLAVGVDAREEAAALSSGVQQGEVDLVVAEHSERDAAELRDPPSESLRSRRVAACVLGHVAIGDLTNRDLTGSRCANVA
jgi:hypothetical protein